MILTLLLMTFAASGGEPTTAEGRANRNAFPLVRYQKEYAILQPTVENTLRLKLDEALAPVRLLPKSWFESVYPNILTTGERLRLLDSFKETEIWKCSGEYCRACPVTEQLGCVLGSKTPAGFGVVAIIHPCLYGEGKCTKRGEIDGWVERFISSTVYYKLGLQGSSRPLVKYQESSSRWIHKTATDVNEALSSCPGPYTKKTLNFLIRNNAISNPNPALKTCAQKYLSALIDLPLRCPSLKKESKLAWAALTKNQFRKDAEIFRADPFSRKMLCRSRDAKVLFTSIDSKPILFLFDGACEGEDALAKEEFIQSVVPAALRDQLIASGCIAKKAEEKREEQGTGSLQNGPEVRLESEY